MTGRGQYRNWVLTLNNPTPEDVGRWAALHDGDDQHKISYFVFQGEVSASGTPHYQGYVEFRRATRMRTVKDIFGSRIHCERRMGSGAVAKHYCQKPVADCDCSKCVDARALPNDGLMVPTLRLEFGIARGTAGRPKGNFAKVIAGIREGKSVVEMEDEFPATIAMFPDKVNDYAIRMIGERDWAMDIEIFVGPSGSGKSTTAKLENPGCFHCPWPTGGRWWWPGYAGQEVVVCDEFRDHCLKLDQLFKFFDRHPMKVEAKGRSMDMVSRKIVLTTNVDPREWYGGVTNAVKEPLARRIREFGKIYDFAAGHAYPNFVKVLRTDRFEFNDPVASGYRV